VCWWQHCSLVQRTALLGLVASGRTDRHWCGDSQAIWTDLGGTCSTQQSLCDGIFCGPGVVLRTACCSLVVARCSGSPAACVTEVPPGRYISQGLVRWCPQGFYRENYTNFDAAVSQICLPCQPGITTEGSGAQLASDCNRVLPGYGIQTLTNISSPSQVPTLPSSSNGLPAATMCDIGYYSLGGYCVQCEGGALTRNQGAKVAEECGESLQH